MMNPIRWIRKRLRRRHHRRLQIKIEMTTKHFTAAAAEASANVNKLAAALRRAFENPENERITKMAEREMACAMRHGAAAGRQFRETLDSSRTAPGLRLRGCQCGRPFTTLVLIDDNRYWECDLRVNHFGHGNHRESDIDPAYLPETPTRTVKR